MIVVVGSRHDQVARHLAATWRGAALCDAEDLVAPGWTWSVDGPRTWVVGGARVDDGEVSGVFVRRSTVLPDELLGVHPDDRAYLAAETHAFLVFVLATTGAVVTNPVGDGALGEEAIRPEQWMPLAIECGLAVAPLRLTSATRARRDTTPLHPVEVIAGRSIGRDGVGERCRDGASRLATLLGMHWATCVFDGRGRLVTVTGVATPSPPATVALAELLGGAA